MRFDTSVLILFVLIHTAIEFGISFECSFDKLHSFIRLTEKNYQRCMIVTGELKRDYVM